MKGKWFTVLCPQCARLVCCIECCFIRDQRKLLFSCWSKECVTATLSAGQEYEAVLLEKLCCAGIAFFSEDKLREEGFFKTPDVKLEV